MSSEETTIKTEVVEQPAKPKMFKIKKLKIIDENQSQDDEIDVEAVKRHLTQAKTDLGLFQSMKGGAKSAITTLEELRTNLDIVEDKVRKELSKAEDLL